jgi:hypothetical protein
MIINVYKLKSDSFYSNSEFPNRFFQMCGICFEMGAVKPPILLSGEVPYVLKSLSLHKAVMEIMRSLIQNSWYVGQNSKNGSAIRMPTAITSLSAQMCGLSWSLRDNCHVHMILQQ